MLAATTQMIENGAKLNAHEMEITVAFMLDGKAGESESIAFLHALSKRGETATELRGAYHAIMQRSIAFDAPRDAIDVCGTGGDGLNTLNISTTVAFILASCGATVVKHGNRAITSQSGASDVLAALGIPATLPISFWQNIIQENHIAFLHAPLFHPRLCALSTIRKKIGTHSIFNLLGPLCNPARVNNQLVGVYAKDKISIIAETLMTRKSIQAWVVHGEEGGDEISISGTTSCAKISDTTVDYEELSPSDAGLESYPQKSIQGLTPESNAHAMIALFNHPEPSGYYYASLLNAAAGLMIAGRVQSLPDGVALAKEALDSGKTFALLRAIQTKAEAAKNA